PNPSELCGSVKMQNFIENLKPEYDYIIIDTPPVGVVTDAALIGAHADGTILVVASGNVEIEAARRSKLLLENVKANIIGVVLNKIPTNDSGYYKYYYYSYYHDEDGAEGKKKKAKRIRKHD
ncbi:MAG: capsular biosynthesis protein, partial [Pseudomonadota bacterium]